ncbi:hypothetical protein MLD38_010258 [Melastoma candidum]|uniref:Uncharacterized protein n=1 Tax=Melastoma candidum TaxID=119954 RepID=A0ACB9QZ90_9MYRT|nr:hypothetical protein MLD38_010258 [Melastoma candidum]
MLRSLIKMGKLSSPKTLYPLYIFPSSPLSSSRIQSKISLRIKTIINPFTIPNISGIILTLFPKAKALLLQLSKEATTRLRIPPDSLRILLSLLGSIDVKAFVDGFIIPCLNSLRILLSLLGSIDVKAFVDGFIIPCLKKLAKFKFIGGPMVRGYSVVRRIRLSFSRKLKYMTKRSSSSSYFRFHYNWSSRSYILPVPSTIQAGLRHNSDRCVNVSPKIYSDRYSIQSSDHVEEGNEEFHNSQLDGYLKWLEERHGQVQDSQWRNDSSTCSRSHIDMLAEKFIEERYGMFILEKQESERRFQEMMARSL